MRISGAGISVPQQVKILKGYKPKTTYALTWVQCTDGSYVAADRGATADIYETEVRVYGHLADINNLVDVLQENRTADSHVLTLNYFHEDESIFGADVDLSAGTTATVLDFGTIKQGSWGGYGVDMRLRALSPTLVGTASLPTLQYLSFGFEADSSVSVKKQDTYGGTFSYGDHEADAGTFSGEFTLTTANMRNLRCFLRTTRGASFQVASIAGVKYPWGPRRGAWPITCRCIEFSDQGMWGEHMWVARLKLAEVRS